VVSLRLSRSSSHSFNIWRDGFEGEDGRDWGREIVLVGRRRLSLAVKLSEKGLGCGVVKLLDRLSDYGEAFANCQSRQGGH
jgi:hypothetical protein